MTFIIIGTAAIILFNLFILLVGSNLDRLIVDRKTRHPEINDEKYVMMLEYLVKGSS